MRLSLGCLFRAVGALGLVGCLIAAGGLGYFLYWESQQAKRLDVHLDQLDAYVPPTSVEVYDHEGVRFDSFAVERRIWIPLEDMPDSVPAALIAAEDRRFFEHGGVDPRGIARAFVTNLKKGGISEGGSTLTQQLVKNLLVGDQKSIMRKVQEALLARRLEQRKTKQEILELYLNYVYLGSGNYGVEAASQDYFGVSVREIDVHQAAMLAAMIPAPSRYSPRLNPELAYRQRRRVLLDLAENGQITRDRALAYADRPIKPVNRVRRYGHQVGNAYRTSVRRQVRALFDGDTAFKLGLKVSTPYRPAVQAVAEDALRNALTDLEERQGDVFSGPPSTPDRAEELATGVDGVPMVPNPGDCFTATVHRTGRSVIAGGMVFKLSWREWYRRVRSFDGTKPPKTARSALGYGRKTRVCLDETTGEPRFERMAWARGAAVVMDNSTGHVLAVASGRGMDLEGFNLATQAKRQPGSTFKPYVYGTALESGATQLDDVLDHPISIGGWHPKNSGGYAGRIPMRTALAYSKNTVSVRLALEHGVDSIRDFASRAGVQTPIRPDLTIALGSSEVTVLDQATAYTTIARMGRHTEPVFIESLQNWKRDELGHAGETVDVFGAPTHLPGTTNDQEFPASVAYQLTQMMTDVVQIGTGRRAFDPERTRAGKTGTTNGNVDGWFVGFTPEHTIAVWVGAADNRSMGKGEYGSRTALPAWLAIAEYLDGGRSAFPVPPEVRLVERGGSWIGLPRDQWMEPFPPVLPAFPVPEDPTR